MKPAGALAAATVALVATLVLLALTAGGDARTRWAPPRPVAVLDMPPDRAEALRAGLLSRARVWQEPMVPIERADLRGNPDGALALSDELECRYHVHQSHGMTPKFHCTLPDGDVIKVKFGDDNGEVFAEVAASRLLRALGFGADLMYAVSRVRCFGCPPPYGPAWLGRLDPRPSRAMVFERVSVERPWPGKEIQTERTDGWAWFELNSVRPEVGGASRAELDALRLMAVLLAHWDNKAENQRLVCLPGADGPEGRCDAPFALAQDVGATFGPTKVDLDRWRSYPIWADATTCRVSMKSLPHEGGTFGENVISEEGRLFLAVRLRRLSRRQLRDLFDGARFDGYVDQPPHARSPDAWAEALEEKIRQIAHRPPCPAMVRDGDHGTRDLSMGKVASGTAFPMPVR